MQEDGLVLNQRGKCNIVLSSKKSGKQGLEKIGNAIVDFTSQEIDRVETTIGFQPATLKHQEVLKLKASSIVAVIDLIYYSKEHVVGFARVYMPHEIIAVEDIDFEDTDAVYGYYMQLL